MAGEELMSIRIRVYTWPVLCQDYSGEKRKIRRDLLDVSYWNQTPDICDTPLLVCVLGTEARLRQ